MTRWLAHLRFVTSSIMSTILEAVTGMSSPVMAAKTPGAASARETSTFLMTACAYGLRSTAPWMRPDSFTSAPY